MKFSLNRYHVLIIAALLCGGIVFYFMKFPIQKVKADIAQKQSDLSAAQQKMQRYHR